MKRVCVGIFSLLCVIGVAGAKPLDSILTAASFPKNANDLTFRQRMDVLADDYNDFDSVFDSNGNCISGCAYQGITLADVVAESARATQEANEALADYYESQDNDNTAAGETDTNPGADNQNVASNQNVTPNRGPASNQDAAPEPADEAGEYKCPTNQYSNYIKRGNKVVDMAPLDGDLVVASDIGARSVYNGSGWHQGLDLRATDNTPIYLPADGVVTMVAGGPRSTAGYYIWVYHPTEKIYTRYLHLNKQLVKKGDKIAAGCLIAMSGHSGIGTAGKPYKPHLHYEIKKTQTNNKHDVIDPFVGINRLGRSYKFKSRDALNETRNGQCPIGCVGFL